MKSLTVLDEIVKNTKTAQEISKKQVKQTCNLRHKKTFREITQTILKKNLFIKATGKTMKTKPRKSSSSDSEKYFSAGSSFSNTSEDEENGIFISKKVSPWLESSVPTEDYSRENFENNTISTVEENKCCKSGIIVRKRQEYKAFLKQPSLQEKSFVKSFISLLLLHTIFFLLIVLYSPTSPFGSFPNCPPSCHWSCSA